MAVLLSKKEWFGVYILWNIQLIDVKLVSNGKILVCPVIYEYENYFFINHKNPFVKFLVLVKNAYVFNISSDVALSE